MINSALTSVAPNSALQNPPPQQRAAQTDLSARNPEIAGGGAQEEATGNGIAHMVRLSISFEAAVEQSKQIKAELAEQLFGIANDEPHCVLAVLS